LDSFPLGEPAIRGSPALDFELSELFTLDPDAFSDFDLIPTNEKSMDLYDLEACLNADWRIYSPATSASSEGFSDCQILPGSADIPLMVSRPHLSSSALSSLVA
jgi:transcriptional enhancer factor